MPQHTWQPVDPALATRLGDARRQLHHAAQLATAFGISYVPARADDSHTNLEWLPDAGALASNPLGDLRVAVRVADLTLLAIPRGGELPLDGRTIPDAADWLRERLAGTAAPPARFTLARHYTIPEHPVAQGRPFDADARALGELAAWYANAASLFAGLRARERDASEVRTWPHHFDIATLITVGPGRTIGVGLEPGDTYYDEPYFYVNLHPTPAAGALGDRLQGGGSWHTHEWIGAVLPGSRLTVDATAQRAQVAAFLDSAITRAKALLPA